MSGVPSHKVLRFGIPSLDGLFGASSLHYRTDGIEAESATIVTISGREGTGKSTLALHMASRYAMDSLLRAGNSKTTQPRVIYVSTDLRYVKAIQTWQVFGLDFPNLKEVPFSSNPEMVPDSHEKTPVPANCIALGTSLENLELFGVGNNSLAAFSSRPTPTSQLEVGFVDLVSNSVGDLWSFLNRLIASLPQPRSSTGDEPHLVLVDNVDGFEMYGGEKNSFGERSSVRSRIAQTIQTASRKAHVLFVSQEDGPGAKPLADISDVALRLSMREQLEYQARSIELVKARARGIHRGIHPLLIRTGVGSTTGDQENPDDPRTTNAYVLVNPSLNTSSRRVMMTATDPTSFPSGDEVPDNQRAAFGLRGLDEICGQASTARDLAFETQRLGLRYGTTTAIIGDRNTHKTGLARSFLLNGFETFAKNLTRLYIASKRKDEGDNESGKRVEAVGATLLNRPPERKSESATTKQVARENLEKIKDLPEEIRSKEVKKLLARILGLAENRTGPRGPVNLLEDALGGRLTPALLMLLGRLLHRLYLAEVKSIMSRVESNPSRENIRVLLFPDTNRTKKWDPVFGTGEVTGKDVLGVMFNIWLHQVPLDEAPRGANLVSLIQQEELVAKYDVSKPDWEEMFRALGKVVKREPLTGVKIRLLGLPTVEFINRFLVGALDYFPTEDREEFRKEHERVAITKDKCTARDAVRMLCGIGIRRFEMLAADPRRFELWLKSCGIDKTNIYEKGGIDIIGRFIRHAPPDDPIVAELAARSNNEVASSATAGSQIRAILGKIAPPRVVYATDRKNCESFAKWVIALSPETHLYAHEAAEEALRQELQSLSGNGTIPGPLFCSVLTAAVLHLIRLRTLLLEGPLEVEFKARHQAARRPNDLDDWLNKHVKPFDGSQNAQGALDSIRALLKRVSAENMEKTAVEVSKLTGDYIENDKTISLTQKQQPDEPTRARICSKILTRAAQLRLIDGPALLITTNYVASVQAITPFESWLDRHLASQDLESTDVEAIRAEAIAHIRRNLIVRRLEVHYLATATLAAIIRNCIEATKRLLETPGGIAWNVRFVLEGLATLRETYPNIVADPLFLPTLRFHLSRQRVTSLLIATQTGAIGTSHDEFENEIDNLFGQQIRAFRVRFFGQYSAAVTALPPPPGRATAPIREVVAKAGRLYIDPHFELYSGLESDNPVPVPLEIRLSMGEMQREYQKELDALFHGIFPAAALADVTDGHVVRLNTSDTWTRHLRDFARLHRQSSLNETLVIQIGEYWGFNRSEALCRQWSYLDAECGVGSEQTGSDSLSVFQRTLADGVVNFAPRRHQQFVWNGHSIPDLNKLPERERGAVDRVPFAWDFGFLLCDREAWTNAADRDVARSEHTQKEPGKVKTVWDGMTRLDNRGKGVVSWRDFCGAAAAVASHRSMAASRAVPALDITSRHGQSLACLILEVWASEVYRKFLRGGAKSAHQLDHYFYQFSRRNWLRSPTRGLIGLLEEPVARGGLRHIYVKAMCAGRLPDLTRHSLELLKTLLLLREVIDFRSLIDPKDSFKFQDRSADPEAIASRHWYGTACEYIDRHPSALRIVPTRLPGHFSTRGDWFLAVASGSRSPLLGERAMDLLSSRRANFERLRLGLGLPVREFSDPVEGANPRTRIPMVNERGQREWVRYREFCTLGEPPAKNGNPQFGNDGFHWLWRSSLGDYDAQAQVFEQGILQILNWWVGLQSSRNPYWKNGFHLYDEIENYFAEARVSASDNAAAQKQREIFNRSFGVRCLWEFAEICDQLLDRLKRATPRTG